MLFGSACRHARSDPWCVAMACISDDEGTEGPVVELDLACGIFDLKDDVAVRAAERSLTMPEVCVRRGLRVRGCTGMLAHVADVGFVEMRGGVGHSCSPLPHRSRHAMVQCIRQQLHADRT